MEEKTWADTAWNPLERGVMPVLLFGAVLYFLGRPNMLTYQGAMDAQTNLAVASAKALAQIQILVQEDAAENKAGILVEIRQLVVADTQERKANRLAAIEKLLVANDVEEQAVKKRSIAMMDDMTNILAELKQANSGAVMEAQP